MRQVAEVRPDPYTGLTDLAQLLYPFVEIMHRRYKSNPSEEF